MSTKAGDYHLKGNSTLERLHVMTVNQAVALMAQIAHFIVSQNERAYNICITPFGGM